MLVIFLFLYHPRANPKILNQLQLCEDTGIPLMVVIGEGELEKGIVKIRDIESRAEKEVPRSEYIEELKREMERIRLAKAAATTETQQQQ